jgi:carboxyl-terminal processing protease
VLTLPRSKITLEAQAAKKEIRKVTRGDQELKVGVITVPSFYQDYNARAAGDEDYRSTTRDVHKLLDEIKAEGGVDGLVLDLRENGGGHLSEAIGLVNLFVPKGPVVQLRETGGRVEVLESDTKEVAYDGPLTILVDRFSASASEIFAAAMQDYGRGLVIGQETYGKGSVQNLYPLDRYALGSGSRLRPAHRHDRHVLPRHRRQHAEPRREARPVAALCHQRRRSRGKLARRLAAVEPDPLGRVQPRRCLRDAAARTAARARCPHRRRPEFPVHGARDRGARKMRSREGGVAQPRASARQSAVTRRAATGTRERPPPGAGRAGAEGGSTEIKDPPDAILGEAAQITADLSQLEPRFMARVSATEKQP